MHGTIAVEGFHQIEHERWPGFQNRSQFQGVEADRDGQCLVSILYQCFGNRLDLNYRIRFIGTFGIHFAVEEY